MKAWIHLVVALLLSWPGLVWAEDAPHGGYRGIASLYYTPMACGTRLAGKRFM